VLIGVIVAGSEDFSCD